MHRITFLSLTCCFVFLVPSITRAVTLQYTGNSFTDTGAGPGNLTAIVDFLTPLTDGATLGPADVSSFTITGPAGTMDSGLATFAALEFIIGPTLTPAMWTMSVEQPLTGGLNIEDYITQSGSTQFFGGANFSTDAYGLDSAIPGSVGLGPTDFMSSNGSLPGTWTVVPEPTSMAMLGLGLIGLLAYVGRRKNQASQQQRITTLAL